MNHGGRIAALLAAFGASPARRAFPRIAYAYWLNHRTPFLNTPSVDHFALRYIFAACLLGSVGGPGHACPRNFQAICPCHPFALSMKHGGRLAALLAALGASPARSASPSPDNPATPHGAAMDADWLA